MFYVYDTHGMRFQGSMEQLEKERALARSRHVEQPEPRDSVHAHDQDQSAPGNVWAGKAMASYKRQKNQQILEPIVHAYQIMSHPVQTVFPDETLAGAWNLFQKSGFRHIPVINERRTILGVISDRDILRRINVEDDQLIGNIEMPVSNLIKREAITTDPESDIRRIARIMALYHTGAMPVVTPEHKLVGIISRGDILRAFAENQKLNIWG